MDYGIVSDSGRLRKALSCFACKTMIGERVDHCSKISWLPEVLFVDINTVLLYTILFILDMQCVVMRVT